MAGHWHQPPYGLPNRDRPPTKDPAMQRHSQPAGPRSAVVGTLMTRTNFQDVELGPARRATSRGPHSHDLERANQHAGPLPSRRATSRRWNPHDSDDISSMRSHSHRAGPRPAGGTPMTRNRSKGGPTRRQIGQGTAPAASQTARLHWIQPAGRPPQLGSASERPEPRAGRTHRREAHGTSSPAANASTGAAAVPGLPTDSDGSEDHAESGTSRSPHPRPGVGRAAW